MKNTSFLRLGLLISLWPWLCLNAAAKDVVVPLPKTDDGQAAVVAPAVWEEVLPEIDKIRELELRKQKLPRRALFREDQKSVDQKIGKLMDVAVDILGVSPSAELREDLAKLEVANQDDRDAIVALKEKRLGAPAEALIEDTVNDINARIEKLEQRIAERDNMIRDQRDRFARELRAMGLELQNDQLDFLLGTVIGDTVIDISIAFYNVRSITEALERLTEESLESIEVSRRYYGMYVVLLGVLDRIYELALQNISTDYIPEIDLIRDRSQVLIDETRRLLAKAEPTHRQALENNRQAQEYTLNAATLYRDELRKQEKQLHKARERLADNLEVAMNTYQTVQLSGDLLAVMQAGENLFEVLFDLQIPELRSFDNLELKREFDKLTVRLREKG